MTTTTVEPALSRALWAVAICGALLALASLSIFNVRAGLSVLVGAAIGVINLFVLARSVSRLLAGGGASWGVVVVIKLLGLLAVTFLLIRFALVDSLGLAVGFGALPLGIVFAGLFGAAPSPPLSPAHAAPADDD